MIRIQRTIDDHFSGNIFVFLSAQRIAPYVLRMAISNGTILINIDLYYGSVLRPVFLRQIENNQSKKSDDSKIENFSAKRFRGPTYSTPEIAHSSV